MNKLLFVNIGGVVFQIDDTAYRTLDQYLESIRKKYANTAEGEEIIRDIENRIAELFLEKVGERGAITMQYVEEVIALMGAPEDFESASSEQSSNGQQQQYRQGPSTTRFFRDKEHNVLGGVCSGLAAKFDIDALWLRLAFLIAFFFAGTGLLLYIILWIIIPEAKTTAEKLEMRGEKIDIDNIERTVRDGAKQFSQRMNAFGEEVKSTFSSENMEKTRRNTGDFIEKTVNTIAPVGKTIARIVAFGIMLVCMLLIVVVSIELISNWGRHFMDVNFLGSHIMEGSNQAWLMVTCALALFFIPLLGIIVSMVKYLLGIKQRTRFISITLGVLWSIALFGAIYIAITIGRNFQYEASVNSKLPVVQPANSTMYLQLEMVDDNWPYRGHFDKHGPIKKGDGGPFFEWYEQDSLAFKDISVAFERSVDSNYVVLVNKSARGYDNASAKETAQSFTYNLQQSGDSVIHIPSLIKLQDNEQWREQSVEIIIRVPVNKYVQIDHRLENYLDYNEYISDLRTPQLFDNKLRMTTAGLQAY